VQDSGSKIFVSLAAGVTMASLASWLPAGSKIARVMPNTPCVVGEMAAGYVCNHECTTKDASLVGSMLGALGSALKLADEEDIDAVTGVAGSAPAYVFQFIEALSDGGVRMGLARHVATTLAAKTVRGAATMVLESGKHPGALKDEVTSPGGTTIAAIHALECGGMRAAVMNAVVAATEKSRELGGKKRARDGQDGDAAA
jgi:pyrroline-5-carboxylate reductase